MNDSIAQPDDLQELLISLIEGKATAEQIDRLGKLVCDNPAARRRYLLHMMIHAHLQKQQIAGPLPISGLQENATSNLRRHSPSPPLPSTNSFPIFRLSAPLSNSTGFFSSGWPVAYLVATVICGVSMLVGSLTPVSQPIQVAKRSSLPSRVAAEPRLATVGRITSMVDCKWADDSAAATNGANVPMGQKYALASGLVEITYDTGAKVILQGPVTYEVKSRSGGYLAVGKLAGKVEAEKAKGFMIRTPTATVTDLGTEFGVEVNETGATQLYVFRGLVRVQGMAAGGEAAGEGRVLHSNESARVDGSQGQQKIVVVPTTKSAGFIRDISKPTIKTFDLADVVAGGDGFSGRRNRGIDPRNGRAVDTLSLKYFQGDSKYHRVTESPLIDGVCIPRDSEHVPFDSAGHTDDSDSNRERETLGYVWAGKEEGNCSVLDGVDYSSPGHGMIALHANKVVTFDLDAMRRANPGWRLLRLRGVAGIAVPGDKNLIANGDFTTGVGGWVNDDRTGGVTAGTSSPDGHNMLLAGPCRCHYRVTSASLADKEKFDLSFLATRAQGASGDKQGGELVVRLCWVGDSHSGIVGEPLVVTRADLHKGWAAYTKSWIDPGGHDNAYPQLSFEVRDKGAQVAVDNVVFAHNQQGYADLRVFVDGHMRFQRREINTYSGAMPVVVPIKDGQRFLTLMATDGNNGIHGDHTIFGDPRIEMAPATRETVLIESKSAPSQSTSDDPVLKMGIFDTSKDKP